LPAWTPNQVVTLDDPLLVANTDPDRFPRIAWGGEADAFLVLSDAPEILDDSNLGPGPATLYADTGGRIRGACRVLLFHINRTLGGRHLGVTVRNLGAGAGRLAHLRPPAATVDANGTRAGYAVAASWLAGPAPPPAPLELAPGAAAIVLDAALPVGQTLASLLQVSLVDAGGDPLPMAVQVWVGARGDDRCEADDVWGAPLVPWQTTTNTSAKIRATVPHCRAAVTLDTAADRPLLVDLCGMAPSGGPGASPGAGPFAPVGFPQYGKPTPWLAPSHPQACVERDWPYQADPAGFDGAGPAGEYVAGWNFADQTAEGVGDPGAAPAPWYRSSRFGTWMRQWNYGLYGCDLDIAVRAARPVHVAVTPARERFSCPWLWYQPEPGRAGGVPWEVVASGRLHTRYGGESTAYVLASHTTGVRFVSQLTAGAYAPYRFAVVPA